jgi:hypothetical protein
MAQSKINCPDQLPASTLASGDFNPGTIATMAPQILSFLLNTVKLQIKVFNHCEFLIGAGSFTSCREQVPLPVQPSSRPQPSGNAAGTTELLDCIWLSRASKNSLDIVSSIHYISVCKTLDGGPQC